MSATLIADIGELVTCDGTGPDALGRLADAALVVEAGRIAWIGPADRAPGCDRRVTVDGRAVIPGFVDSHTHLAFAGDRAAEFAARMAGASYDGGGISATVAATRAASDAQLRQHLTDRVAEMAAQGTTTIEIKSGYGLDVESETRLLRLAETERLQHVIDGLLRLAREFTSETTYLGGHVVPSSYASDRGAYVELVCGPMLDACAPHARWIDVFCEPASPHAFDGAEARTILSAGLARGLLARVHGNQLGHGPGVALAVELGAASRPSPAPRRRPWQRCCRGWSSRHARPIRTRGSSSMRVSPSRWRRTATRARATPRRCPSSSRSRSVKCA